MRSCGYISAVVLAALACASCGSTSPSSPSDASSAGVSLDVTGAAQISGRGQGGGGGGGGNGGTGDSVFYNVAVSGPIALSATLELTSDTSRVVSLNGDGVQLTVQFSAATVNANNCHWTDGVAWDHPDIQALASSLTSYDAVAGGVDIVFSRRYGTASIRRRDPWAKWCVEEDGTSGGCAASETIAGDGTRTYEISGTDSVPQRWVRTIGGVNPDAHGETYYELVCRDNDTATPLQVTATPVP